MEIELKKKKKGEKKENAERKNGVFNGLSCGLIDSAVLCEKRKRGSVQINLVRSTCGSARPIDHEE